MTKTYENRRFMRSEVALPITLQFGEGQTVTGQMLNISIIGIYVRSENPMPAGSECEASFDADILKPVQVRCKVVYASPKGMGLEITGIASESYEFLRELIAENAEDSFACDTEIISNMANLPPLY